MSINPELEAPDAVLARVDASWERLCRALEALPEPLLERPDLLGEWSCKDVVAHISRWDDRILSRVQEHLAGRTPADQDYQPLNEKWAAEDRGLSLSEARGRFHDSHRRMRELLGSLAAQRWDSWMHPRVAGCTWEHYDEHWEMLRTL